MGRLKPQNATSKEKSLSKSKIRSPDRKAKETTGKDLSLPSDYLEVLEDIKKRVYTSRIRASVSVNRELILLYWEIGRLILQRQETEGWGTKVIDRLSDDLKKEFPDMKGFSTRNLKYMRRFAENYPDDEFVQQAAAQIPLFHNYLSAVDDQLRHPDDQSSIGLILCKERNRLVVGYALRDTKKPMGVATYRVLPRKLKGELPTARQIEKGIKSHNDNK